MESTKELRIKRENIKLECGIGEHEIWHPLYMECYISGLKNIFSEASERKGTDKFIQESVIVNEKSNVLTFIGKRGAGKTTAMDEFCRILKSLEEEKEKKWWMKIVGKSLNYDADECFNNVKYTDFKFHILDPIDASLFGANEDLFEQIIVNIYRQFESKIKSNESRKNAVKCTNQIMQQFSDVMKMYYSTIRENDGYRTSDTMADMMQFLSSTQNIQKAITELVDSLLQISNVADMEYIVVPIDDLDLNIKQGYQMLEKLQKYFTYHKILILLTIDYDQMRFVCEEHFGNELVKINSMNGNDIAETHKRELARDFMTKMFHLSQRLCMPNLEKDLKRTYIICEEGEVVVKKYIFKKIAYYMGIWYDINGLKKHFAEPKTVRELVVYNDFLNSLNICDFKELSYLDDIPDEKKLEAEKKNENILKEYDQNHERFNEDIQMRMAQNILRPEQRGAFERLCDRDLERRARYFVRSKRVGDRIIMHTIDASEYSYGDLLQKIYEWGRTGEQDSFIDKPYISCILASFTSEMVREYLHYLYSHNNEEKGQKTDKHQKRLMGILGESFGNKWTGDAFPKIIFERTNNSKVDKKTNELIDCLGYKNNIFKNLDSILSFEFKSDNGVSVEKVYDWIKEKNIIPILELIDMFVIGKDRNQFVGISYKIDKQTRKEDLEKSGGLSEVDKKLIAGSQSSQEEVEDTLKINILTETQTAYIDAMAFVIKSMFYQKEKERIQSNLLNLIKEIFERYGLEDEYVENECKKIIKEETVIFQEKSWCVYQTAFPFYNLDLSYNVYKRVWGKFHNSVPVANLELAVKEFFNEIKIQLEEEEREYNTEYFKYADIFKNNNYVKAVLDYKSITKEDPKRKEELEKEQEMVWKKVQEILVNMSIPNDKQAEDNTESNDKEKKSGTAETQKSESKDTTIDLEGKEQAVDQGKVGNEENKKADNAGMTEK